MESVSREKLTADFGEAFLTLQHTYNICMQLHTDIIGVLKGEKGLAKVSGKFFARY